MKNIYIFITIFLTIFNLSVFSQGFDIYVSDAGNWSNPPWQILKFDENGENPEVFIDNNLAWPQDILFLEDRGIVLISNLNSDRITKHNISDGSYVGDFAGNISGPTRIKIGPDGLLYVLQWSGNGKVKRYQLNGKFIDDFTSVGVSQCIGLDWDDEGNLYVSSYKSDLVRKFDGDGKDMGVFVNTNLLGPTNIWFDDNGDLLVSDYNGTAVKRFDADGNYVSDFLGGLRYSEGIDFLPNGNILVGNGGTSSVKMFDSQGNYIKDIISGGSGNLLTPNAIKIREKLQVSVSEEFHSLNNQYILSRNYPNPFNPATNIEYSIPVSSTVEIKVYDLLGNNVRNLVGEYQSQGRYTVKFRSESLSSGVYIYRLFVGNEPKLSHKMILMK